MSATESWDSLMLSAYRMATTSQDPSTQNAAVLVVPAADGLGGTALAGTWAVNGLPRGVASTPQRWEKPAKYALVEHAERNSVYAAARAGLATDGLAMVCPWHPCTDCARAIIQAGVSTLVNHQAMNDTTPPSWAESIAAALGMLEEAGVEVITLTGSLGGPQVLAQGSYWTP